MRDDLMKPCPFCRSSNIKFGGDDKRIVEWCLAGATLGPNRYGCYECNSRANRIEELEAKLAKAVEVLIVYENKLVSFATATDDTADEAEIFLDRDRGKLARNVLAELKGETE